MKAIVRDRFGPTSVLRLDEVPMPEAGDGEVVVRVHKISVNDTELGVMRGKPLIIRFFGAGWFRPRIPIIGCDVAGTVHAVGPGVTRYSVGDDVLVDLIASDFGGYAEYACAHEDQLTRKPASMSFAEAAALPQAAALAMQALIDKGDLQDGQKILINGAGGGVGTLGLQIAKQYDVDVTCVDSADKFDTMRALGADAVIDYRSQDYTQLGEQYDLIVDNKTFKSPFAILRALKPGGMFVTTGGSMIRLAQLLLLAPFVRWITGKRLSVVALVANKDMDYACQLYEAGRLKPVIDEKRFRLADGPAALDYFESARHKGKVIIDVI